MTRSHQLPTLPPIEPSGHRGREDTDCPPLSGTATNRPTPAHDDTAAIRTDHLCVNYPAARSGGTIAALCDLTVTIRRGEHVALLGPSGSGKSTFVGCLGGRLTASRGHVHANGPLATIHQDLRLVKQRTALQNVLHGALGRVGLWRSLVGFPKAEVNLATNLLERVGLADRLHWPVGKLSGGEQQRVAIARALMQQPRILLADEPVASLDHRNACAILKLINDLAREDELTVVSVLHDRDLAEAYTDRTLALSQGALVYDSSTGIGQPLFDAMSRSSVAADQQAAIDLPPTIHCPQYRPPKPGVTLGKTLRFTAMVGLIIAVYVLSVMSLNISSRAFEGTGASLARFVAEITDKMSGQRTTGPIRWGLITGSLGQTLAMSLVGTTVGVILSWPLAALGARNVGPRGFRHGMRFFLNAIRTVPSLIWALIFVAAVGLGPLAGILALCAYSVGYLTKFFYEEFEAVDPGPPDALKEIGAGGPARFFHAVWPASRAAVLSSCFFMFEYNVRAASVLGIVGAGGIGYYLREYFAWREFDKVAACLLLLLVVVVVLDGISTRLRARLVG